jgi:hypothetical protein
MSFQNSVRQHSRQTFLSSSNAVDDSWKGDEWHTSKAANRIRILFQNVRSFKFSKDSNTLQELVHLQESYGIDILCVSEHHQDTSKINKQLELSDIVHSAIPGRATCQFDSSAESNPIGQTKPGGTGIIIVGPMTGELEPQGKGGDSMGRWSYTTFRRQGVPPITIISVYQVCKEPTNVIGFTAWHQQKRALDIAGRNTHPRTAFIDDLCKVVMTFQAKQHAIIVGGDFNECLDDPRSGLLRLATTTGLADPWQTLQPNYPEFATRDPGSKRIDSVLVSPSIYDSISSMGYSPVARFVDSDHRGEIKELIN